MMLIKQVGQVPVQNEQSVDYFYDRLKFIVATFFWLKSKLSNNIPLEG